MIKYVITKEIEVDEYYFETEDIGMFDTEEEAIKTAESLYNEMPSHEKQYYEIIVWKVSGDSLKEPVDWDAFTAGESVKIFSADPDRYEDETLEMMDDDDKCNPDNIVHICTAPLGDGIRLWVGDDPNKYVDRALIGFPGESRKALADWYNKYGKIKEESWKECFPERQRKRYIRKIMAQEKTYDEALEILSYLPQTDSVLIDENVLKMIKLWESGAKIIYPYRMPLWIKKVLQGEKDVWPEDVLSPRAERAWKKGWLQGRAELVKSMSETRGLTYHEVMELLEVSADDQEEILKIISEGQE